MSVYNGWSLVNNNPEVRKYLTDQVMRKHPGSVVIMIHGFDRTHCTTFVTHYSTTLATFIQSVAHNFHIHPSFILVFEGRHYPDDNLMGDIHHRWVQDDGILYGYVSSIPH